jgi:cell division protein FtsI (penicillin-binding protein 3)
LTFQPAKVRTQLAEARQKAPSAPDPDQRLADIARDVAAALNNKPDAPSILKKLRSNETFVYLARAVDPGIALSITDKYPEVGAERQDLRQYPGGSLAANVVGGIDWDGHGLLGLEDSMDSVLAGTEGSITYDRGSDGVVIPGSYRNRHEAVNGSTVQLTLDDDIQFYVQQQVQLAKNASGARNVSAVVLDAKTGELDAHLRKVGMHQAQPRVFEGRAGGQRLRVAIEGDEPPLCGQALKARARVPTPAEGPVDVQAVGAPHQSLDRLDGQDGGVQPGRRRGVQAAHPMNKVSSWLLMSCSRTAASCAS